MKEPIDKVHRDNTLHQHTHKSDKEIIIRMNRIIGHTNSIKKMIEEHRDCSDILIQIAAVRSALNNAGKILLKDHISSCLVDTFKSDELTRLNSIKSLNEAIDRYLK